MPAEVGSPAPDFSLPVSRDKKVSLADYTGQKSVVLAFYVYDFTGSATGG